MMLRKEFRRRIAGILSGILIACATVTPVLQVNAAELPGDSVISKEAVESNIFDPVTADMVTGGILTISQANATGNDTEIALIGQLLEDSDKYISEYVKVKNG